MGRGEKEGTAPVAVTDAFRINKSVNLISESDMTDGSAFFIANVNKHTNHFSNGVGIFVCMSSSINFSERKPQKNYCIYFNLMSNTPKKPGKKGGRKAKQREASNVCRICRINVKLNIGLF